MKKNLYKMLWLIALPITIQNLILSSVNMADVFMIGKLGSESVAALGLANQIVFLLTTLLSGINSGGAIFVAQYFGKGQLEKLKFPVSFSFWVSNLITIIFTIIAFYPQKVLNFYTSDPQVIGIASEYLKIVAISFFATGLSYLFSNLLRGLGQSRLPMFTTLLSLVVNITLNYLLIFGNGGFPQMGVKGAALATTIARVVEASILVISVYLKKSPIAIKLRDYISLEMTFAKVFIFTAGTVMFNDLLWALGQTVYSSIYGNMSTMSLAAINIENSIERIAFTGVIGFACAAAVIVGQEIGKGNNETAYKYSREIYKVSFGLAILCSLLIAIFGRSIVDLFRVEVEVADLAHKTLLVFALVFPLKALSLTKIVGVLRGGGDTRFAMKSNLGALWFVGIPLAYFGAFHMGVPVYFVYLLATSEELIRLSFGAKRFMSKKWMHNLVNQN